MLVTGGAGFIGSHLVDALVDAGHRVRVLDDLSTGRGRTCTRTPSCSSSRSPTRTRSPRAVAGTELVFHLGALGAVSRSVADPLTTDRVNVHGTLAVLTKAADAGVRRVVFASSSSVYGGAEIIPTPGDSAAAAPLAVRGEQAGGGVVHPQLPGSVPARDGRAAVLQRLRSAPAARRDVRRGDPALRHRAAATASGRWCYGDGLTTRDFTFVSDVVAANLAAADAPVDR